MSKGVPVKAALIFYLAVCLAVVGPLAFACGEETAYRRVADEAQSLGGQVKEFANLGGGTFEGLITGRVRTWDGRDSWATFIVFVDRRCNVELSPLERR